MLRCGEILNDTYEVMEEIGQGGGGIVYLAYHLRLQKKVVIKKMKESFGGNIKERREADILKSLHHKYLPQVYDFVQMGDTVFTVMDYIEGWDLLRYIQQGQQFDERQLLIWLRQLAEVLEYLHGQHPPIVHSDIKPSNIMITLDGCGGLPDGYLQSGSQFLSCDYRLSAGGGRGGRTASAGVERPAF